MSKLILDISENNGYIDFEKVKQAGIEGVIIRIGWIGNKNNHTIDKYFLDYYNRAKNVGLKIGFYVYSYVKSLEALKTACQWILNQIQYKSFELPLFLDLEDNTIESCGKENLTEQAIVFCRTFENLGIKSGIYANKHWFENYIDVYRLIDLNYKIWLAEWNVQNPTVNYRVDFWQSSSDGQIPGINGRVDINNMITDNNEQNEENQEIIQNEDEEEVKMYFNGSTKEDVYSDTKLTNKIGSLNPYEQCECLGIYQNRAIVRYKVDNKDNYKIGFAKWLGGVK